MSVPTIPRTIRVFYSYAATVYRDKNLYLKIRNRLSIPRRNKLIDDEYDSGKAARSTVEKFDDLFINQADIIVLLVSPCYFASDRCAEVEMKRALEREKAGEARLIPVLLYDTDLEQSPLSQYTFLPSDGEPVQRRPSPNMDRALLEVSKEISKAAKELAGLADPHSHSEPRNPLYAIPYEHNNFFTDRKDILAMLHTYFTSIHAFQQTRALALHGLAGSGKTQVAVEYVHLYKHEYQTILWLEAVSRDSLREAVIPLAESLNFLLYDRTDEQQLFSALKHWLQQHDQWLVILDNIIDFNLMDLIVPSQSSGHILLTSYSSAPGDRAYSVSVAQMKMEDSTLFLLRRAKFIGASKADRAQAVSIIQAVDGLTLALDQAGAYIEEKGCNLSRYLELYRQQETVLLDQRGQLTYAHPNSVKVTFSLAFKEVAQKYPDVEALVLLRLLAFLRPDAIPREMIEQGVPALGGPFRMLAKKAVKLEEAIAILLKFSLIQRHTSTTMLSMHRVVQTILIEELMPTQQPQWAIWAVRLLNYVFPSAEFSNWQTCEKYFAQARRCAELITKFQLKQKEAADLLQHLGSYCYQRAYYQDAEKYLTTALQLYERRRGPDQSAMALTLNNLALLSHKQGNYHEAEERYQRAWRIREQTYGPDDATIAQTLNNLALLYKDWGKYQQAEELYERVLHIDERTVGSDHPDIAVSLSNLAQVYEEQGKYSLAELLYQRAFSIEERTLNADHPDLALSLNMQATQHEDQGNYPEAEALYQHALAIQEKQIGRDHPDTAQTLNNLAGLYEVMERYQEAEVLYQRALNIFRQAFGLEHPDCANILNNLGYLFHRQQRFQEAEVQYRQALTIYEQTRGREHPDTANVLNSLGSLYHVMKKDELAEPLLRRGLDIHERIFGLEHLDTCRSLSALAELFKHQHLYEQAEPLYQRVVHICRQVLGPGHPETAFAQEQYALVLEGINEQRKT